jgi:hypothetical protein
VARRRPLATLVSRADDDKATRMTPTIRLLLAGLAVVLVSSLAVAALWPASAPAPQTAVVAQDAVAPSSGGIFPKVLHR